MIDVVIIGIGNSYRSDDGVGHAAAEAITNKMPDAEVLLLDLPSL